MQYDLSGVPALAADLNPRIRLGASTWSYPG